MKEIYTSQRDAVKIARDIICLQVKTPVLAFVKKTTWEKLKNQDDVVVVDATKGETLEDFKDKAVVFCTYKHFNFEVENLADNWEDYMTGDTFRIVTGDEK